jgi:membrane-bound ClpP family serine protease
MARKREPLAGFAHCGAAWGLALAALCAVGVGGARGAAPAEKAPPADKRIGCAVRLTLPITGQTVDRAKQFVRRAKEKAAKENARLTLILEFQVLPDQAEFGRGSEFGAAWSLADYLSGKDLNGVQTVAYVPQAMQGHALLVMMACDEIMMAKTATIGPAGVDEEVIIAPHSVNYREIATRRHTVPVPVALWLLDPSQEVLVVQLERRRDVIFPSELDALRKEHAVAAVEELFDQANPDKSWAAEPGKLSGSEARKLEVVKYLAESRKDVAKALDLPPEALDEDPALVSKWTPVRVELKGPMRPDNVAKAQRLIEEKVAADGVNFVLLTIDSPGGSLRDSTDLARFVSKYDPAKVRIVAYVARQARSDAALAALACHQLIVHPTAELGGPGSREFSPVEVRHAVEAIRDRDGPWRRHAWSLPAAIMDPQIEVYRCTRPGETAYFGERELDDAARADPAGAKWQKHEQVTTPGEQLLLSGQRAKDYGLAFATVEGFNEIRQLYGLEHDPRLVEPGWADVLIRGLASPGASALLLLIGFMALYIELHTPGVGVGGFVATVCFVVFFWAHYLDQTAGWLEVALFVTGVCCLLLEFFVLPGFGIFGLGGGLLVLASLILASQTFVWPHNAYQFAQVQRSLLTIFAAGAGFAIAAAVLRKWLPNAPVLNQVFLPPPQGAEAETISRREALAVFDDLLGARGTATTQLTPSGKGRFGERLVDVMTEGDLVPRGAAIEVVAVKGVRVIVREVDNG